MNRSEHLQWCKDRALEYVKRGEINGAYASLSSDMQKHPETKNHPAISLGMMLLLSGHLSNAKQMIDWIKGFN